MEENNETLDKRIEELHTAFEKSQQGLIEKFERYIEDDKYEKELDTIRQLCQKLMDLYQINKKKIEQLEDETEGNRQEEIGKFQKVDKEIKSLIDDFNLNLQEMNDTIEQNQKSQIDIISENIKKQDNQIDNLMKQFNDALVKQQEEIDSKKEEIDLLKDELERRQARKLIENEEEWVNILKQKEQEFEENINLLREKQD